MKNKTFLLTMILIVIVIGVLGYYLYSMANDKPISISVKNVVSSVKNETIKEEKKDNNTTTSNETSSEETSDLVKVTDYQEFFNVDKIINNYYESATKSDGKTLLNVLDSSYIKSHKITSKNISKYYITDYQDVSFYSREMYSKTKGNIMYVFVKGDTQNYKFALEELTEGNNVYFMICIDRKNSTYSIYPLSNVSSTYTYGTNYNMPNNKTIEDNDSNTFFEDDYSDYIISTYYLNYFKGIIYLNTEKAYNMLGTNAKVTYVDLEAFNNDLENIYNNTLSSKILGYNASGEDGKRTYILNLENGNKVTIIEESIMNFTIDF